MVNEKKEKEITGIECVFEVKPENAEKFLAYVNDPTPDMELIASIKQKTLKYKWKHN